MDTHKKEKETKSASLDNDEELSQNATKATTLKKQNNTIEWDAPVLEWDVPLLEWDVPVLKWDVPEWD